MHSLSGDNIGRDLSEHAVKQTEPGTLTNCRQQMDGVVRTQKGTDREMNTHVLETTGGGCCQDRERNQLSKAHSLSGDGRGRYLSGHGKKLTDRGALTS